MKQLPRRHLPFSKSPVVFSNSLCIFVHFSTFQARPLLSKGSPCGEHDKSLVDHAASLQRRLAYKSLVELGSRVREGSLHPSPLFFSVPGVQLRRANGPGVPACRSAVDNQTATIQLNNRSTKFIKLEIRSLERSIRRNRKNQYSRPGPASATASLLKLL